ncbi:hypothetical protein GBAR_LOCUS24397, partial [Geodia barretti]
LSLRQLCKTLSTGTQETLEGYYGSAELVAVSVQHVPGNIQREESQRETSGVGVRETDKGRRQRAGTVVPTPIPSCLT